jgi:DNA-binding transcriptional MerR regulator
MCLRFWETKFTQIKPLKRGGGRRYYRPEDVALLRRIHHLLYTEGYTIKGVQKLLKGQGKTQIVAAEPTMASVAVVAASGPRG